MHWPHPPHVLGSFNPRPCTRGDAPVSWIKLERRCFQSTPLHEGRQKPPEAEQDYYVSIHAPARGATWNIITNVVRVEGFQSTPPHEGRPAAGGPARLDGHVSIHAPARGATQRSQAAGNSGRRFNPRPRTRGDTAISSRWRFWSAFQSTPPHEGRQAHVLRFHPVRIVSIHAPARGATVNYPAWFWPCFGFNPRPRTRGDSLLRQISEWKTSFQSTPPHEGRPENKSPSHFGEWFQSTPPHEGRLSYI